jgi:hypothetical protein
MRCRLSENGKGAQGSDMKELILLSFGTASLSVFFDMCMQEGMILYRYYRNIEKFPAWIFKPLGGCVYCSGTWIFICTYLIIAKNVFPIEFVSLAVFGILGIGLNHVFIKLIERI